ncbi:MAG: hypothetical protein ACI9OH_000333 [Oleispira sp.]|jgi:hypothetical protein
MDIIKEHRFKLSAIALWAVVSIILYLISNLYIDAMFSKPIKLDVSNTTNGRYITSVQLEPNTLYGYVSSAEYEYSRKFAFVTTPRIQLNSKEMVFINGGNPYSIITRWIRKPKVMFERRYFGSFITPDDNTYIIEGRAPFSYKNHNVYLFKDINESYFYLKSLNVGSCIVMCLLIAIFIMQIMLADFISFIRRIFKNIIKILQVKL